MGKIPPQAKKVFSGVIYDVYQWEQAMFDGSPAIFEMLRRPNTVCVIPAVGDRVLLAFEEQPNKGPQWTLFGGRQEQDETPIQAAQRELLEESGYVSDNWELFLDTQPAAKIDWHIYTFIARDCEKKQPPHLDVGEKITEHALGFDRFIEIVVDPAFSGRDLSYEVIQMQRDKTTESFQRRLLGTSD